MPSSARSPNRILAGLVLLALLAACEESPPPGKPASGAAIATTPEEVPVAAEPAPAQASAAAPVLLAFSADDARIGTEIGERSLGRGMSTTGLEGWLVYGPYVPVPAGRYQVEFRGSAYPGHSGLVHFDVAQGKGVELLATADIDAPALLQSSSPDGIAVLPFTLAKPSTDLEVRVRVSKTSNLSISGYVIRSLP